MSPPLRPRGQPADVARDAAASGSHTEHGQQSIGVTLLGRILELPPALFLFSLLSYRFQNESVCGCSSPFCCASDALLEILWQANGGCGHRETPCEKIHCSTIVLRRYARVLECDERQFSRDDHRARVGPPPQFQRTSAQCS